MKISSIQQLSVKSSVIHRNNLNNQSNSYHSSPNFTGYDFHKYGDSHIYIWQMDKLKKETQLFPQDIEYRKKLMGNAGLNPVKQYMLRSIIGPQEIKSILKRFDDNPDIYSVGEKDKNIINHKMRANLHIHTTSSDGSLTVTELLDKAAEYANKVKSDFPNETEPFVIAITDHDTTDGANEAIKVISEKPLKYKNLRVILGVEMTTFNNIAPDMVKSPTNTHVLLYGIDPNEPRLKDFIDGTKAKKLQIEKMMTDSANKSYEKYFGEKNFFSVNQAKEQYNAINKNIIGIYNGMERYFETKSTVKQILLKDKYIVQSLKKHNMPTDIDGFMTKFSEFHTPRDGNNKVQKPIDTLPEFISATIGIKEETVVNKILEGEKTQNFSDYKKSLKSNISEYKTAFTPKYHYIPNFDTIYYNLSNQSDVIMGVAHPVDTVKNIENSNDKYKFMTELYKKFKSDCKEKAQFTEAYYQSYKPGRKEFNAEEKTQKFFKMVGKTFNLLRTGSADSHGLSVFKRL